MFTRDVSLEGFTHEQWARLGDVFRPLDRPAHTAAGAAEGPNGGVVAVTTGSTLRKVVSTRFGRIDVHEQPWPEALESLAARHGARWAAEISTGALDELMDRFGERLSPGQDYLAQALEWLGIVRELEAERLLTLWPWRVADFPLPSERAVGRALDLLCPSDKSLVLGVFEAGALSTCLVVRRRGSGFDRLVGPDELGRELGLLSGDFRRDHRHLALAVEKRVGKIAVGCYGELHTFRELAGAHGPGAWARAVAAQEIVISPWMPAAVLPLGLDAGRAVFHEIYALASRFGAGHFLSREGPLAQAFLSLERPAWLGDDVRQFLGFDPWDLLVKLFARGRGH
ncbi:MAG TPA: hypothetical protein VLJ38_19615 [Polyangiaceae bacterium]|nr:hypothetical protein [Polyangiaceae bacterium]